MPRPIVCAAALVTFLGCKQAEQPVANPSAKPAALAVVVCDAQIAKQISRLKGEWKAQSGIELKVRSSEGDRPSSDELKGGDAVIFPTAQLGVLAEAKLIRSLPPAWLNRDEFHKADLFDPGSFAECRWGEQTYAVPFGSPVFVLMYRRDIFERHKLSPPRTWTEYQQAINVLKEHQAEEKLKSVAIEPLASGWAGKMLLARAAAYAKHPDYYATLFDKDTMAPQIAGPPFIRALQEMVAAHQGLETADWLTATPESARVSIVAGDCAMAITWPTGASAPDASARSHGESTKPADRAAASEPAAAIGFAELPGGNQVFNLRTRIWSPEEKTGESSPPAEVSRVPLVGIAGLLGAVSSESKFGEAAFQLLSWLSGDEWGSRISSASAQTTIFRRPQLKQPGRWVEAEIPAAAAKQYADVIAASLSRPQWLGCLQIPGNEEYMAALDEAVRRAVDGKQSAAKALEGAGKRWQGITERIGMEAQRAAYLRSLGLEP